MPAAHGDRDRRGSAHDEGPSLTEFAGVGLQFAVTIVVFLFLGQWLDGRLGTSPWLTVLGVFLGAAGGFLSLYTRLMAAQRRADQRREK
jgi:ATP synthase protein I